MSNITLFLSPAKFKKMTPASKNVAEDNTIDTILYEAQYRFIEPILCDAFYEELVTQVSTDTLTNDNEAVLVNFIQPAIAFYTLYLALPYKWIEFRDAGPIKKTGDDYETISKSDLVYLRDNALMSAQDAALRLEKQLQKNAKDLYPTYYDCTCEQKTKWNGMGFLPV